MLKRSVRVLVAIFRFYNSRIIEINTSGYIFIFYPMILTLLLYRFIYTSIGSFTRFSMERDYFFSTNFLQEVDDYSISKVFIDSGNYSINFREKVFSTKVVIDLDTCFIANMRVFMHFVNVSSYFFSIVQGDDIPAGFNKGVVVDKFVYFCRISFYFHKFSW